MDVDNLKYELFLVCRGYEIANALHVAFMGGIVYNATKIVSVSVGHAFTYITTSWGFFPEKEKTFHFNIGVEEARQ